MPDTSNEDIFTPKPRIIEFPLPMGESNAMFIMALTGAIDELDNVIVFHERGPETSTLQALKLARHSLQSIVSAIYDANESLQDEYNNFASNRGALQIQQNDADKLGTDS